ncbi:MAG: hypothetical protein IKG46_06145 [Solobacterium sp.]|nr:hypothetical protein [Solobacterium sp.]
MQCTRCKKSIPERALRCPYCGKKTAEGWRDDGRKLVSPITNVIKKIKKY